MRTRNECFDVHQRGLVHRVGGDRLTFGSFTAEATALAERIEAGARDGMLAAPAGHS